MKVTMGFELSSTNLLSVVGLLTLLIVVFSTLSVADELEFPTNYSSVTTDPSTENDGGDDINGENSRSANLDSRSEVETGVEIYLNNGSCCNNSDISFLYLGLLPYYIQHTQCVGEVLNISEQHGVQSDCAARFCTECIQVEDYQRNCHTCCGAENMVLSRIIDYKEENQVCNNLDLPTCATGIQRCRALERLINTSFEDSCPLSVTREIVEDCIVQSMSNTSQNSNCTSFPLFYGDEGYNEDDGRYGDDVMQFCSKSRVHSMICGIFCRKGGRILPKNCRKRKKDFCVYFIRAKNALEIYERNFLESEEEEELYSSSLFNFAEDVGISTIGHSINSVLTSIQRRRGKLTDQTTRNILDTFDVVFNESYSDRWMNLNDIHTTSAMFHTMNRTLKVMIDSVVNYTSNEWVYRGTNMAIDVMRFQRDLEARRFSFPQADQVQNSSLLDNFHVSIPFSSPCNNVSDIDGCSVTIGVSVIKNFAEYINDAVNISDCMETAGKTHRSASSLLSVEVKNSEKVFTQFLNEPVKMRMMPEGILNDSNYSYQAYFLDSYFCWNSFGVNSSNLSDGLLEVMSNHLTSFAILVSPTGDVPVKKNSGEGKALALVTYIGCSISIVCLCLTLLVLVIFRKKLKKGVLLYIHINLTVSLLLAMLVFVAGVDHASFKKELCVFVAALIQYLFLCAFFWMLGEGVMLYLLIVKVFGNTTKRWYLLMPICWGVPAAIVAVSAGVLHDDYTANNGTICWINAEPSKPAIWTFLVPLILIVLINSIIFIVAIISIVKTREVGSSEWKKTRKGLLKMMIKSSLVLIPLLGLTWVVGLFAVVQNTSMFAWMFTIINSLQGLFIFLMHIVRNDYIMAETKKKLAGFERYRKVSTFSIRSVDSNGKTASSGFANMSHRNNSSIKLTN